MVERPAGLSRRQLLKGGLGLGAAALFGTPALAACSKLSTTSASGASRDDTDAQLIVHTPNNVYFQQWILGFNMACEDFGLKPHVGYSNNDPATHVKVLSAAASRGARYVTGVAPNDAVVKTIASMCEQNDIMLADAFANPVWDMVETISPSYVQFDQSPDFLLCYQMGKALFEEIGGEGEVIHLLGNPGQGITLLRAAGYRKAASEYPGIKIVAEDYGLFNRTDTEPKFAAMLTAHPDIKAVVNASDDSNIGCISVLKSRNIKNVKMTSIDAIPEYLQYMEQGEYAFATGSILGSWMGMWLMAQVYDAAQGYQLNPLERQVTFGSLIIKGADAAKAYSDTVLDENSVRSIYQPKLMSRHLHPTDWRPQNLVAVMEPLDPTGAWVPEGIDKPADWQPPQAWTDAASNNGIATINADYTQRFSQMDPLAKIRSAVGETVI